MSTISQQDAAVRFDRHSYEDPFLDMASTMLPKSYRKLQELCQIFALQHPQISPIIWRLAEYPITSIVYTGQEEAVRINKQVFDNDLQILDCGLEWGLDYYGYGNCFVTVSFPFERFYECKSCSISRRSKDVKYVLRDSNFEASCHSTTCGGRQTIHKPVDRYIKRANGIKVIRLEPMLITPKYNRATGKYFYYYDMPADIKTAVKLGDRDIIDSTPKEYLDCVFKNTKLRLKRVFHFKRPTLSGRDMQWGLPLVLPALKDAYLNQIYKKSDEMIASEHSVPLRIMFPEPGTQDPLAKLSLGSFRQFMNKSIQQWRQDKNAIITAPLPIGVKVIGGDQGAYSTIQARQFVVDEIIGAMGVTKGFIMGGEQWSAASISHRILENSFTNYTRRFDVCLQWVAEQVQRYLGLPECTLQMKPFKKVDDIQMMQLVVQMARENRVSWDEALSRMDIDAKSQMKKIEEEAGGYLRILMDQLVSQAEAGAKSAIINAQAQQDAEGAQEIRQRLISGQGAQSMRQPKPSEGDEPVPPKAQVVDIKMEEQVERWANELMGMDEPGRQRILQQMATESPEMGAAVSERASKKMFTQQAEQILSEAKNPDEIAQRMMMLPPKTMLGVSQALRRINPMVGIRVMAQLARSNRESMNSALNGQQGQGQPQQGGTVDQRPLPEQKPPRRTNSPI